MDSSESETRKKPRYVNKLDTSESSQPRDLMGSRCRLFNGGRRERERYLVGMLLSVWLTGRKTGR